MPKLTITTNDGELVEQINLDDYDLGYPIQRADLMMDIAREASCAIRMEQANEDAIRPSGTHDNL